MTRTTTWLSVLSCAAVLAACSVGCGGTSPAGKSDGGAGKGGSGGATAGSAGATAGSGGGAAGDNGTAGATAGSGGGTGGATAGSGGSAGGATAGSGGSTAGAAGTTTDGGNPDTAVDSSGSTDAGSDTKADTAEVAPTPCVSGGDCSDQTFTCSITRTCRKNQEEFCFCAPNNKVACEPCDVVDAGVDASTDASADSGTDAGNVVPACPTNVNSFNTACDTVGDRCTMGACNTTTHRQQECSCFALGNNNARWICGGFTTMCP
jgi:hypothetical protein